MSGVLVPAVVCRASTAGAQGVATADRRTVQRCAGPVTSWERFRHALLSLGTNQRLFTGVMMVNRFDWDAIDKPATGFGIAVALAGVAGYVRKRSTPSLVAGVGFGTGIAVAANMQPEKPVIATVLSALLTVSMLSRYLRSKKFIPSGLVAVAAAGMTGKFIVQLYDAGFRL